MQRVTISLDDELARQFEELIARRGYVNRSEAFRDLVREAVAANDLTDDPDCECVGVVSYSYNHHERQLAMRLTEHQHEHTGAVISTMHVHLSHDECAEAVVIRGSASEVRHVADTMTAEPGIRHGRVNLIPVKHEE